MSQAELVGTVLLVLVFAGLGGIAWIIHRNRHPDSDALV